MMSGVEVDGFVVNITPPHSVPELVPRKVVSRAQASGASWTSDVKTACASAEGARRAVFMVRMNISALISFTRI
jgi:hypothetical protein